MLADAIGIVEGARKAALAVNQEGMFVRQAVNVADAILTGAGLSFLGLGLPPDTPDWGIDLARGQQNIQNAWWLVTFPGVAVMLVVLSFTMMGEGLVEIFNPKLRER